MRPTQEVIDDWMADMRTEIAALRAERDEIRRLWTERGSTIDGMLDEREALRAQVQRLSNLAHHLRHCRECGEMDVDHCQEGKPLWDAAIDAARATEAKG